MCMCYGVVVQRMHKRIGEVGDKCARLDVIWVGMKTNKR